MKQQQPRTQGATCRDVSALLAVFQRSNVQQLAAYAQALSQEAQGRGVTLW